MNKKDKNLKVAAIGDLHAHEAVQGAYKEIFAQASKEADVLLLCGDLTNSGQPEEAKSLSRDLGSCSIPALAVLGNHDYEGGSVQEIKKILSLANVVILEDESFELKGVGFAGVKGFGGGFGKHMLGSFGEEPVKSFVAEAVKESLRLENELRHLDAQKKAVVLHYAPIAATAKGEPPEIYPFLGCSRLEETIGRFSGVAAVFHGHAHHGALEGKTEKNVPVYNCCRDLLIKRLGRQYILVSI